MISLRHLVHFTDQLSLALKSGLPINRVLHHLEESGSTRRLRLVSKGIREEIERGASLGQAFEKYNSDFPDMLTGIIAAGEESGHLEDVSRELADFYTARYRMISSMKWEFLTLGVLFLMFISVLIIVEVMKGADAIPMIISASMNMGIFVLFFILIPRALYMRVRYVRMVLQPVFHAIPILGGILCEFALSRFSMCMALGLKVGMDIRKAIQFSVKSTDNIMMERNIIKALDHLEQGDSISQALSKTGVFPVTTIQLYTAGEESGNLSAIMNSIAVQNREHAEIKLGTMTKTVARGIYTLFLLSILFRFLFGFLLWFF